MQAARFDPSSRSTQLIQDVGDARGVVGGAAARPRRRACSASLDPGERGQRRESLAGAIPARPDGVWVGRRRQRGSSWRRR